MAHLCVSARVTALVICITALAPRACGINSDNDAASSGCSFDDVCVTAPAQRAEHPGDSRLPKGENAINSIRMRRGHDPVVQVLDASGETAAQAPA